MAENNGEEQAMGFWEYCRSRTLSWVLAGIAVVVITTSVLLSILVNTALLSILLFLALIAVIFFVEVVGGYEWETQNLIAKKKAKAEKEKQIKEEDRERQQLWYGRPLE